MNPYVLFEVGLNRRMIGPTQYPCGFDGAKDTPEACTQWVNNKTSRQAVYRRLAGYEGVNDAERLAQDPTFRLMGSERIWERGAALTSRLQSFETELLAQEENLSGLTVINPELNARAEAIDSTQCVVLDMDSSEIPVYGQPENSAYNGHFESTCYHPLLLINGEGRLCGGEAVAGQRA